MRLDQITFSQDHRPLENVRELPDISFPAAAYQDLESLLLQTTELRAQHRVELTNKIHREKGDVPGPVPERRKGDVKDVQPIKEVVPESSGRHLRGKLVVCTRDDTDVYRHRFDSAHDPYLPFFDHSQQLHLQVQGEISDLVEVERALVGDLEESRVRSDGVGERPFGVAEELALQKSLRDGPAVNRNEALGRTSAGGVDRPRDDFFTCSALPRNQDTAGTGGDFGDLSSHLSDGSALSDEAETVQGTLGNLAVLRHGNLLPPK